MKNIVLSIMLVIVLTIAVCSCSSNSTTIPKTSNNQVNTTFDDFVIEYNTHLKETEIRFNATTLIDQDSYDSFLVYYYQPLNQEPVYLSLLCDNDLVVAISICHIFDFFDEQTDATLDSFNSMCRSGVAIVEPSVPRDKIDAYLISMEDEAMLRADCTYEMIIGNTTCNIDLGKEQSVIFSIWPLGYKDVDQKDLQNIITAFCYQEYFEYRGQDYDNSEGGVEAPSVLISDMPNSQTTHTPERKWVKNINYYAIEGCVIVKQDSEEGYCKYNCKCEACGYVQKNITWSFYGGGSLNTAWLCIKCQNRQNVVLKSDDNSDWAIE